MKHVLTALAVVAAACAPFQEPTPLMRDVGSSSGDAPKSTPVPYRNDAGPPVVPDAGCCAVRFALAATGVESAVSLFGLGEPLRTPVPLVRDGGAWETVVCMPLASQVYGYQQHIATQPDGGGELFVLVTHNPNAPSVRSAEYGSLNLYDAADAGSCAGVVAAPHGDATPQDAGNVFVELDGGDPDGGASDGGASDGGASDGG